MLFLATYPHNTPTYSQVYMDNSELQPIIDFMGKLAPFDSLPEHSIKQCCQGLTIAYYSKQQKLVPVDSNVPQLYIVRSGAFEVTTERGGLIDRVGEGQYFGFSGLLSGEKVVNQIHILEDGLVYHLPAKIFDQLRANSQSFDRFFNQAFAKRLRNLGTLQHDNISTARITHIMSRDLTTITADANIHQAALLMSKKRLSSLVVVDQEKLCGILTDRDLRNRVLAKGLNGDLLVGQVMTKDPIIIEPNALMFEAMLKMSENNIHHLPVVHVDRPVGIITSTDLIRSQSSQPLLLIGQIERQNSLEALIKVSQKIPDLLHNLISSDAKAIEIGRILTSVTDSLTRRLIVLKQEQLGPAPMGFCWLAFGSQGRQDQMAGSDQDNALILEKDTTVAEKDYFKQLSESVCGALNECGFPFCPGNIMAQNPQWQLTLQQWQQQFSSWVKTPQPSALLNATIFFDMRGIFGDLTLLNTLQSKVLKNTKGNDIFIAALSKNALQSTPPLGFFRSFVIERDGSEVKGIDLKHKGNALINDIVRIYALAAGIKEVNTSKRLEILMAKSKIDKDIAMSLLDAWEFIAHKRLINQGQQFNNNQPVSNYILPDSLSSLVRHQLKDAFKVIHEAKGTVRLKFLRQF
jgi:CBS domain-containing protein